MGIFQQFAVGQQRVSIYISDMADGNLAFHVRPDAVMAEFKKDVEKNREALFNKLAAEYCPGRKLFHAPVFMNQKHSITVRRVDENVKDSPDADAMIAENKNMPFPLAVMTADCIPLVMASEKEGTVLEYAVVHAGRVGLLAGIIQETAEALFVRSPEVINIFAGPHICGRCYEVSPQLWEESRQHLPSVASESRWGTPSIDLLSGLAAVCADISFRRRRTKVKFFSLTDEGIFPVLRGDGGDARRKMQCTYEDQHLFSYRRYVKNVVNATRRNSSDNNHNIINADDGRFASVAWVN